VGCTRLGCIRAGGALYTNICTSLLLHTRHTSSPVVTRPTLNLSHEACRGPALATAESKPNVPRDRPYMPAQARSERRPSSLRAAHRLHHVAGVRHLSRKEMHRPRPPPHARPIGSVVTGQPPGDAPTPQRAIAGAGWSGRPAAALTLARLAGGIVEGELWTGSWRSSGSKRRCIARRLLILPRCAGVCVGALVHWSIGTCVSGRCEQVAEHEPDPFALGARANHETQSAPPELGPLSR
jgi:hypothetical protein